jgi:hypothetical protein
LQRRFRRRFGFEDRRTGLSHHDARMLDGVGQRIVITWEAVELGAGLGVDATKAALGDRWRHAVGFGEDDIETDRHCAKLRDAGDQIGDGRTRPRPLPDLFQTGLVDIDNDHRPYRLHPRPQHLKEVEGADAQFRKRSRIGKAQRHQREQKREADRSRDPDLLRPSGYPFHCRYPITGVILPCPGQQREEDRLIRLTERAGPRTCGPRLPIFPGRRA